MKSTKTYLIVFLALTTLGGAALAWRQYQELVELRGAALDKNERADLQKKLWDLEKANRELQDQLAALRTEGGDVDGMLAAADQPPPRDRGNKGPDRGGRGRGGQIPPQAAAIRDLLAKPEVQAMIESQRKLAIEERYASLFRNLNLSTEQADKLKTLLAERQTSLQDVREVAREQGIDPRSDPDGFRKLIADTRNEIDNNIKSVIGDSGYSMLQNYEQTMPQRNVVDQLQNRLARSGNEMSPATADQLVSILAQNAPPRATNATNGTAGPQGGGNFNGGGGPGGGFGGRGGDLGALAGAYFGGGAGGGMGAVLGGGSGATITPAAVNQAQGILTQAQLAALQQTQQQQQQQQQLRQLVNDTLAASQAGNANRGATTTGGATGATGNTGNTGTTTNPGGGGRRRGGGG